MIRAVLLMMLVASISGCMLINRIEGNEVPHDRVEEIRPGVTTRAEILDWFGAPIFHTDPSGLRMVLERGEVLPEDVLQFPYADVLVFERSQMRERRLFLLLFIWFEGRRAQDRLVVFFDQSDRVMYYGYRQGTDVFK